MAITSVTKDGGYLVIVEDGVTKRRSIVYEDAVCSLPPTGYTEVGVVYIDEANNTLIVQYNGSSVAIELDAASGLYLPLVGGAMAGAIAMGANKITGLADPTAAQDAATRAYVLARTGLYLPLTGGALTGDLTIGANLLKTTNLAIKELNSSTLAIRNAADSAYKNLILDQLQFSALTGNGIGSTVTIQTRAVDSTSILFKARDNDGDVYAEVARLQSANDPYFQLTLPCRLNPSSAPGTLVEGHFWYDATADKLKYRDASGTRTLAIVADMTTHEGAADPHTGYQKESEKGAASGYASLSAATKVVEQPASITDHLDGSPDEDDATKAPTSEWAFDHNANTDTHHSQAHLLDGHTNPTGSVEFNQQQALQFVIENRTSDPGSPVEGQTWIRTDLD